MITRRNNPINITNKITIRIDTISITKIVSRTNKPILTTIITRRNNPINITTKNNNKNRHNQHNTNSHINKQPNTITTLITRRSNPINITTNITIRIGTISITQIVTITNNPIEKQQ